MVENFYALNLGLTATEVSISIIVDSSQFPVIIL